MVLTALHKLIAIGAVLGAFLSFHYIDKSYALKQLNIEWVEKLKRADKQREIEQKQLKESFNQKDKEKQNEITNVNTQLANALSELRKRPSRPSVITITETREVCTGAQLYREDAEFLAREAARAERIRIERDDLYDKYEEVRERLERLNGNRQEQTEGQSGEASNTELIP